MPRLKPATPRSKQQIDDALKLMRRARGLPPIYSRFSPGWFVSEAVVQRVHTQFIEHNGRYYAGYANLGADRKCWTIKDIEALERTGNATEVDWFPEGS